MIPKPNPTDGLLHPTPKDYPNFLKFLSQSYGFSDPRWFENDASFFFGTQASQLKTKWMLKIDGRFAAHVGIFPFTALVEGRRLKVAGIGAVATHPDFRGHGLMKRLMDHAEKQIAREGYDLSILWGERGLYRLFGYERALFLDQFTFLKRHLKYFASAKGVRPGKPADAPSLQRFYSQHPFRIQRTSVYSRSVHRRFHRDGFEPLWVLEDKGRVTAYAIVLKPASGGLEVAEWGGRAEDVACLWATVLQKDQADFMTATVYPGCGLYGWALENCSNQVRMTQSCMVKPLRFAKILRAFEPQLQRRYQALGLNARKTYTLRVEDGQAASLKLGNKLQVVPVSAKGISLTLSLSDCTRLLFGPGRPLTELRPPPKEAGLLDGLFPLEWYWWRSDWI